MHRLVLLAAATVVMASCSFAGEPGQVRDPDAAPTGGDAAVDAALGIDAPTAASCIPADNMVACYDFELNADDGSSFGHNGTFVGSPDFVTGHDNDAVALDGTVAAQVAESAVLDVTALTIEAWISPESFAPSGQERLIFDNQAQWAMGIEERALRCTAAGSGSLVAGQLVSGGFTHVACTATNEEIRLYINGDLVECLDRNDSALVVTGTDGSAIGANLSGPQGMTTLTNHFQGAIDSMRIFNVRRSRTEICSDAGRVNCAVLGQNCGS